MLNFKTLLSFLFILQLTACGGEGGGSSPKETVKVDRSPDTVSFDNITDVALGDEYVSHAFIVTGIDEAVDISVVNASYAIDDGSFVFDAGKVTNGQSVTLKVFAAEEYATTTQASVTIGSRTFSFDLSTIPAPDSQPDAFYFPAISDVAPLALIQSMPVTITGIEVPVPVSVRNGLYNIAGGEFTADNGMVSNGQIIYLQVNAAQQYSSEAIAWLNVAGEEVGFSVTTIAAPDLMPEPLTFNNVIANDINLETGSNTVTIMGINRPVEVSIDKGEFAIDGGEFTPQTQWLSEGQTIQIRLMSSGEYEGVTTSTLTIGELTTEFVVNTTTKRIATDKTAPEVELIYPSSASISDAQIITVYGKAKDANTIESVWVAGTPAVITQVTLDDNGDSVAHWQASIALELDQINTFDIATRDNLNHFNDQAATFVIRQGIEPKQQTLLDPQNQRILSLNEERTQLKSYHLVTEKFETIYEFGRMLPYPDNMTIDGNILYVTKLINANQFWVDQYDLTGEQISSRQAEGQFDFAEDFNIVKDAVYVADEHALFYAIKYYTGENSELRIFKYDIASNSLVLIADNTVGSGVALTSYTNLVYYDGQLIMGYEESSDKNWLMAIDITSGDRALISAAIYTDVRTIAIDPATHLAYLSGFNGIYEYSLMDQTSREISKKQPRDDVPLSQIRDSAFLPQIETLLIKDDAFQVAVNVKSGQRTRVNTLTQGTGPALVNVREMVSDSLNKALYIYDDSGNDSGIVMKLDTTTGDREIITIIKDGVSDLALDLAYDPANQQLIVLTEYSLYFIDPSSLASVHYPLNTLTQALVQSASRMALDTKNNQLYFSLMIDDVWQLVKLDIASKAISYVLDMSTVPNNENLFFTGLTIDAEQQILYGLNQNLATVYQVDLTLGSVEVLFDECLSQVGSNLLTVADGSLQNIVFDVTQQRLLFHSDYGLLEYSLSKQECEAKSAEGRKGWIQNNVASDLVIDAQGKVFTGGNQGIYQLNESLAEGVLISR